MHVKVKINIVVCGQNFVSLTWTFLPISKDFDSQGMAASRAAHFPHILRASRQMTAAARHNAACRRVFCALQLIRHMAAHIGLHTYRDHIHIYNNITYIYTGCTGFDTNG